MQVAALLISLTVTVVAVALFARGVARIVAVVRRGQPAPGRTDQPGARTATMLRETLGHTRMLQWSRVGAAHWFLMIGFGLLFATLVNAYGQLVDAHFVLPLIGHFPPFEWLTEVFPWAMVLAIVPLIVYRATRPRERVRGPAGRFYGSTMWQGYFVELVILGVGLCILTLRGLEYALAPFGGDPDAASALHFPLTAWLGGLFTGLGEGTLSDLVWLVAMTKIVISMAWLITLALNPTSGLAWHRFTVWPNIWFKRNAEGAPSLGAAPTMLVGGEPFDLEKLEELDENASLGVGRVED